MAGPNTPRPAGPVVASRYLVERNRPLPATGGLPTFGVVDQETGRTDLMAIQLERRSPARSRAFHVLSQPLDGLLTPLAEGSSGDACYAICPAPPGPSLLAKLRPWSEPELMQCVLRPVAHVLEHLHERKFSHRAIRLDNVFQAAPGQSVVLGVAWASPPAIAQPALFEPPYSAMCLHAGRGEGNVADDVYALGVLLVCLALGRVPLAQLDEAAVLRSKLELGTYAAVASDERLPPVIGDLVRGMLAEDPEHRPTPTLLLDPASARGRRVAARPPRRAQRPIGLGSAEVWDARSLACAMAQEPEQALQALRCGAIERWLRRGLGDAQLATHIEECVHHRTAETTLDDPNGDSTLVMRAITVLDPLAPLCWRGIAVWPDGIGTALAAAMGIDPDTTLRLEEIIAREEVGNWAALRADRCDLAELRIEGRQYRSWLQQRETETSAPQLTYLLNPMMPCASLLVGNRWVARLPDLLPALEEAAGRVDHKQIAPIDLHVASFIAARLERRLDGTVAGKGMPSVVCLAQFRLLAQLQARLSATKLPGLAAWLVARAAPVLATWRNRERRAAVGARLAGLVSGGQLASMVAVLDDPVARSIDMREAQQASEQLNGIDAELDRIARGANDRAATALRLGQEIAAGFGLVTLATVLAVAALG